MVEEEGIETQALATMSEETFFDDPSFSVFPALERSESFIRRRVKKREGQECLVKNRLEGASPEKKKPDPVDLDEVDEEEEMIRQHSSYGSFGILTSSRANNGKFRSYRRDQLIYIIDSANKRGSEGHGAVLKTLRNARILVYIIDAKVCVTLTDVVNGVRRVVDHVCRDPEYREQPSNQKCLLYRDYDGRLFNLVLTSEYSNSSGKWRGNLNSFSIVQAGALFTFLTRSLGCAFELETTENFRQVYLVLILGVVFLGAYCVQAEEQNRMKPALSTFCSHIFFNFTSTAFPEEISLSWTNVALLVRGIPSMSAFALTSSVAGSDWLRKILILIFIVASSSSDETFQKVCTLGGIILTCLILLANLGSLSWKYLHWKPFRGLPLFGNSGTVLDPLLAYIAAVFTGICFPFMGHCKVEAGGTAAVESVMRIAVVVAVLFILSDYDAFQRILVLGCESSAIAYSVICLKLFVLVSPCFLRLVLTFDMNIIASLVFWPRCS
jgi:hypothetical protein